MSQQSKHTEKRTIDLANRLHGVAIHLLRRIRQEDPLTGLSPARLSALSVIGFGGPRTISELAEAEQVALPTISRIVTSLVSEELVERQVDAEDRRTIHLSITPKGMQVLLEGQRRRTAQLGKLLEPLSPAEQATIAESVLLLERLLHGTDEE
jgi:DNA-binding MarR family transcriptional regulator